MPARAKGFCSRDRATDRRFKSHRPIGVRRTEERSDDSDDLDRRSRRAVEEALGSRPLGQPDRGGTRQHHPQRGDRQGAPARPLRPRQEPVIVVGAAPAQAAPGPAHDADFAPACRAATPRSRMRSTWKSKPIRIRIDNVVPMSQRSTLLELTEETCHWPVGDPGQRGLLLLRRQVAGEPAVLRAPLAHRLSAGHRPPTRTRRSQGDERGAKSAARHTRARPAYPSFAQRTIFNSAAFRRGWIAGSSPAMTIVAALASQACSTLPKRSSSA